MNFVWYLLLGLATGWIANLIVKGGSSGLLVNLIVGMAGGLLGGWLYSLIGLAPAGSLGSLATAVIGAAALLWIAGAVGHKKIRTQESVTEEKAGSGSTTPEAENAETMELLGGMLDNATRCGDTPEKERTEEIAEQSGDTNRGPANR